MKILKTLLKRRGFGILNQLTETENYQDILSSEKQLEQAVKQLLTSYLSADEFKQITGIEPKKFFRYWRTLRDIMYNSDGSLSKFARTYGLRTYDDLYDFLLKIKNEGFRKDHIIIGFEPIIKMAEVVIPKLINRKVFNDFIPAMAFTYRTIAEIIDDLRILKKMFRIITKIKELHQEEELSNIGREKYNA